MAEERPVTPETRTEQQRSWIDALAIYIHRRVIGMFFLGFSAGLPFLLVFSTLSLWLREEGVSRTTIGFFAWIGITYSIKVFWAPIVDTVPIPYLTKRMGARRSWILLGQLGVITCLVGMALTNPSANLSLIAVLGVGVAFFSSTQDIAIDAYRIEAVEKELQAAMASTYIFGYRIALLVAGAGALLIAAGFGWTIAYIAMAGCMLVGVITVLTIREPETFIDRSKVQIHDDVVAVLKERRWRGHILSIPENIERILTEKLDGISKEIFTKSDKKTPHIIKRLIFSLILLLFFFVSLVLFRFIRFFANSIIFILRIFVVYTVAPLFRFIGSFFLLFLRASRKGSSNKARSYAQSSRQLNNDTEALPDTGLENLTKTIAKTKSKIGIWFIGAVIGPFVDFFVRNAWMGLAILVFVGIFRISDLIMGIMANPFYTDLGYSKETIAEVTKFYGLGMTLAGAGLGGVLVARFGIMRTLLLGAVLIATTNLLFAWLANYFEALHNLPAYDVGDDPSWLALKGVYSGHLIVTITADNLSGGLATTAFIAYLSSLTNRAYTATQYALFSSLMTLPGKFISGWSGVIVDASSYVTFFVYASIMGIPAILLVLFLMRRANVDRMKAAESEAEAPAE